MTGTPPDRPAEELLEPVKPKPASPREAIVEALMRLAAIQPWDDIEVGDIAREAGVSLSQFRALFPSKGAVLGGFARMIDQKVLGGPGAEDLAGEPARERIFDVVMRRLDAMEPYKPALKRITAALRADPLSLLALNNAALNSQRFMLAAAGVSSEGPLSRLKLQGAVIVFANTMQTWLDDDDPALAKTMARLDRELRRGERVIERAEDLRRLTAPFRALGQSLLRPRARRADRHRYDEDDAAGRDPYGERRGPRPEDDVVSI